MSEVKKVDLEQARAVALREAEGVMKLADQLDESLARVIEVMWNCEGHILVTGAGTSRAVAQRFAHLLACCGTPALFISAADALHGGAGAITAKDVVFVISKGGRSKEINQFVEIARSRGARIVSQCEDPASPLAGMSDAVYKVVAPEGVDPYGMIATGSSLVNAAAGDVLCILLLGLRGYTKEAFGQTHPGGAVGEKLSKGL